MAVRIRLTRVGATKRPAYRVIAIDKRRPRDGRALEILGFYDPLTEPATVRLETARIKDWIGRGAQPSETVVKLMAQAERAEAALDAAEQPARPTRGARRPAKKAGAAAEGATAETSAAGDPEATGDPAEAPATAGSAADEKAEA